MGIQRYTLIDGSLKTYGQGAWARWDDIHLYLPTEEEMDGRVRLTLPLDVWEDIEVRLSLISDALNDMKIEGMAKQIDKLRSDLNAVHPTKKDKS